jgi:hypothetical protein
MRRLSVLLALLALTALPVSASAQSLIGSSQECGTYSFEGELTKGTTDAMLVKVDHKVGCFTYHFWTLIGTGYTESYGWKGQQELCQKAGREAAVGHFHYYRGIDIEPSSVNVSCSRY